MNIPRSSYFCSIFTATAKLPGPVIIKPMQAQAKAAA
jgi:hypothetical protein